MFSADAFKIYSNFKLGKKKLFKWKLYYINMRVKNTRRLFWVLAHAARYQVFKSVFFHIETGIIRSFLLKYFLDQLQYYLLLLYFQGSPSHLNISE